jgi:hypothetical protein
MQDGYAVMTAAFLRLVSEEGEIFWRGDGLGSSGLAGKPLSVFMVEARGWRVPTSHLKFG